MGALGACLPGTGPALDFDLDAAPPPQDLGFGDAGATPFDAALGDSFAITGLTPSHGPFSGGTRTRLDGRGFTSKLEVTVGGGPDGGSQVVIPSSGVLASDPTRAALVMPAHEPGFVDITLRDESTQKQRTLQNAYVYDPITVTPSSGASSGGTNIVVSAYPGTGWDPIKTTVEIGGQPCVPTGFVATGDDTLECTTPAGTPGSKDVVVHPVAAATGKPLPDVQVRDAFTYSDAADGYRGGLSGGALAGRMKVIALSEIGTPIKGAAVIIGDDVAHPYKTTANGVIEIPNIPGNKVTVTVASKCAAPVTYVDVPVDTLTVYMSAVLTPACLTGDPPIIPGAPNTKIGGYINGEVLFPGGSAEFERNNWTTVPLPARPTERRVAYAFEASSSPNGTFQLPSADQAITPESDGSSGYKYQLLTFPGNITMYVIAGLEDRSQTPASFIPYAMGIARGVSVNAQGHVDGIDVKMDILFDHEVKLTTTIPPSGPRGPDQLTASLAITLGASGYAIVPRGTRTSPLPPPDSLSFIGVPALDHGIAGEQYVLGARATSLASNVPLSVISRVRTTDANGAVNLGGFLAVPVVTEPAAAEWDGTHFAFTGSTDIADLTVITVADSLVSWTIVAPKGANDFDLPDLNALDTGKDADPIAIAKGLVSVSISSARIDGFEYGRIRTGQLSTSAWNAYAQDSFYAVHK